ncbi:TPA: lipopolysaccharide biosynthesis protein [Stenotrophomonas maltophilia]
MAVRNVLAVLRTLIFRGLGSGIAVLFTVLVSRMLPTSEAALFFVLFNTSVIASVCFRWGMDEVVIRRIAAADAIDRKRIAVSLVVHTHRRVLRWVAIALLLGLLLCVPSIEGHVRLNYFDFCLMVLASGLIACAASAARVMQANGRVDAAIFYLNIFAPALSVVALLLLSVMVSQFSARDLMVCYLLAAAFMYVFVVISQYGAAVLRAFSVEGNAAMNGADIAAANRLGAVVLAQQALGWSAVGIVPAFFGDESYAAFVVSQKLATLISLLMLAINFTFSSKFASLHAQGQLRELWKLVCISVTAILAASIVILMGVWLFMPQILSYARVPEGYAEIVLVMMIGQVAFSVAAIFALVLSMCRMEVFLLRVQMVVAVVSIAVLAVCCASLPLYFAVMVFPLSYGLLASILCVKVRASVEAVA